MPHTLLQYSHALARRSGLFVDSTTTGASTATNSLTMGDLADGVLESGHFNGTWARVESTASNANGEIRRANNNGFSAGTGVLTVSRAFSTSVASAVPVRLYGTIPPIGQAGQMGWREIVNLALRDTWKIDTLVITPANSTTYTHDLSTCPWQVTEDDIIDVWTRSSGVSVDTLVPEWRFQADMDTPLLELKITHSTSDTIRPKVYRPLDTWISTNGSSFSNSTVGLVADSDVALLPMEGMIRVGLSIAYESLSNRGDLSNQQHYARLAEQWRTRAASWKAENLERQAGRDLHWITGRRQQGSFNIVSAVG